MDELRTVRELYGEPPPDPLLKARVRGLLDAEPRRRRGLLPWTVGLAGLATAAAVTAAAVVVALPRVTGEPPGATGKAGASSPASTVSGRSILLAAATTAESGPSATGAYWHVRKLNRRTYPERLGSGANRYWMVESRLTEQWVTEDGRVWSGSRALGAAPGSGADEEAWRRDGSPATWRGRPLSTSPGKGALTAVTGKAPFSMAGRDMTIQQIRALPTDPEALRRWVTETVRDTPAGSADGVVADALGGLLWSKPSPPDVRAAAYRALAELPNVRYLGRTTDERGRQGAAFSFTLRATDLSRATIGSPATDDSPAADGPRAADAAQTAATVRRTLIIDSGTSQVLSSTVTGLPGGVGDQVEVVLEAAWTNTEPTVPAVP
ncbi:CU044_5270 family protein [Streptosporangium carneum]|uniref:CU044_5270 family protein n=1 Tax=Streptosporangium carneum TaxID=47481 RepID=A0A9W6I2D4_9ACTN|nr:CU044_5270 family protein [Streptosporangium carneum]GLK09695.1 hypothetical protein GCM10017600_31010 [Streptosporangium carneum]